ncbi:MAG: carbohydrate ABC transporter permease [Bacillota bacterium]|nr:carbohydrate ABC transporter permease [Bacillota bacterium]
MAKKHKGFRLFLLTVAAVVVVFPVVFMISNSFMKADEAAARYVEYVIPENADRTVNGKHYVEPTLIPSRMTVEAYRLTIHEDKMFLRMFWNSVLITLPILIGQLLISPLAAYAFEMIRWKYKEVLYFVYIIVMLMPIQLLMVPHYITAESLGYNNTWWAIILPAVFAPFGTFLLRQQLSGFDRSLIEAARVEGATEGRIFVKVILPFMKPSISALAALTFVECWNIVDQAVVFIRDVFDEPLSVYLSRMIMGSPGLIFAAAVLFMVPAFAVFILSQEYLAGGIAMSGGKKS